MAGLQVDIYASIGVTWFAALATLIMRVIARRVTRVGWWYDDYFSILAFVRMRPSSTKDYVLMVSVAVCDWLLRHHDRV
jgi:hypothetical protein